MALIQTDDHRLVRDTETRALLSTDATELLHRRRTRRQVKQLHAQQQTAEERFNVMNQRLDRCESLLHELVQHISSLVANYHSPTDLRE